MIERETASERLLEHRIAVITGAAKGIGSGIAFGMAKEGATVVLVDIDTEGLAETKKQIQDLKGNVFVYPSDVRDKAQNNALVDAILEQYGRIDILVNNAGISVAEGLLDTTEEGALSVFQTNLIGPYFLTQRVAQEMIKTKTRGTILFTSSVHGQTTMLRPSYSSSKAGLEMLVKEAGLELAQFGIRVNAVAPGAIAIRGEQDRTNPHVPFGYSGTPEDIADAMVFLASHKASYITGQTLTVDGGFALAHTHHWINEGKM